MIGYSISRGSAQATIRLDVDNTYTQARLELTGDPAVLLAWKRAVMQQAGLSIAAFNEEIGALRGSRLIEWMGSGAVRELAPVMTDGADILRDGGTFARHDCAASSDLLGTDLGMLATRSRTEEIFADGYQWEIVERQLRGAALELAAWDRYCGAAHQEAVLAAIAGQLERRGSTLVPATVLRAFRETDLQGDQAAALRRFWAKLDELASR